MRSAKEADGNIEFFTRLVSTIASERALGIYMIGIRMTSRYDGRENHNIMTMNFGCFLYKLRFNSGSEIGRVTSNRISLALLEQEGHNDQASSVPCRDSDAEHVGRPAISGTLSTFSSPSAEVTSAMPFIFVPDTHWPARFSCMSGDQLAVDSISIY